MAPPAFAPIAAASMDGGAKRKRKAAPKKKCSPKKGTKASPKKKTVKRK